MVTLENPIPNLQILALGLAVAVAAAIAWTFLTLRRKPAQRPASLYEQVLTSSEYAVKGRFED